MYLNIVCLFGTATATVSLLYKPEFSRRYFDRNGHAVLTNLDNKTSSGSYEQNLLGGPLTTACYNIDIFVTGVKFTVQVDSGSSDLIIPGSTLNSYDGPTFNTTGTTPLSSQIVGAGFVDTSGWTGLFYYDQIAIYEGAVGFKAPFAVMLKQTSNPPVTDGSDSQGLIGLAFESISTFKDLKLGNSYPATIMDALYNQNLIAADMVAFRSCPSSSSTQSILDWGASDPNLSCIPPGRTDSVLAWAKVISKDYYTVNITSIKIGNNSLSLGSSWQTGYSESIFDSCTTIFMIPRFMFKALVKSLLNSDGFPGWKSQDIKNFLTQGYGYQNVIFDFSKMPSLTFTLLAEDGFSTIDLVIPPQDYIQQDNTSTSFLILQPQDSNSVVFGGTAFEMFYIVLDRKGMRVGLGLGCDCATKLANNTAFSQIIYPLGGITANTFANYIPPNSAPSVTQTPIPVATKSPGSMVSPRAIFASALVFAII